MSLLKLAEFVAGRRLSDRAGEAEWQGGISIWNFNKDEERSDASRHAVVWRGVSENSSVLSSVHARHLISWGNLIWRMLTRTKDRLEENMENIAPSSTSKKKKERGGNGFKHIGSCFSSFIQLDWSSGKLRALMQLSSQHFSKSDIHLFLLTG